MQYPMTKIHFTIILISLVISPALISTCHGALLIWEKNNEPDLAGYKVYYRNSSKNYYESVIDVGMLTEHKLRNIKEDQTYYLTVTAYDFSGNESKPSEDIHHLVDDGIPDHEDNCPQIPNGPEVGTCSTTFGGVVIGTGVICTSDADCEDGETCQMDQEDYNSNGIGDVCNCYSDFNEDGKVTVQDYSLMINEYSRYDCDENPCLADANHDGKVNILDLSLLKREFSRHDCYQE